MTRVSRASLSRLREPGNGPPSRRLAVRAAVTAAFGDVLAHSDRLTRLALPWLLLIVATSVLAVGHPAEADRAWTLAMLVTLLGAIAISVAWFRWRLAGVEPVTMARLDRHVARVMLRYTAHLLLVGLVFASTLLPLLAADRIRNFSKVEVSIASGSVLAITVLAFMVTFPLFHIYALLGGVERSGTGLGDVVRASQGNRFRLALAYALFFLAAAMIPLFGTSSAEEAILTVTRWLGIERTPELGDLIAGLIAILAQSVALGLSAASASFVATLWPQLAAPPPVADPPQPPG